MAELGFDLVIIHLIWRTCHAIDPGLGAGDRVMYKAYLPLGSSACGG